jgi:SNF2 family DNA or RNA helicase
MTKLELYPYQKKGVDFLKKHPQAILADEMGLGKTAQAIKAVEGADPALIVATGGLRYFWKDEIMKWTGCRASDIWIIGEEAQNYDATWWIVSWESLAARTFKKRIIDEGNTARLNKAMKAKGITLDALVADEAHRMKNRAAGRSKAIMGLQPPVKYLLTGTPIINRPDELWMLLHYLDRRKFRGYWKFFHEYVHAIPNVFGGYEILGIRDVEGLTTLLKDYVVRRRIVDVYKDLPERIYQTIPIEMTVGQRKVYDELRTQMEATIYSTRALQVLVEGGDISTLTENDIQQLLVPGALALLTRLRQVVLSVGTLNDDLDADSPKLDVVMDLLDEREGLQTVVTTQFVWAVSALAKRLDKRKVPYGTLTGEVSDKQRADNVKRFQAGELKVLLMTTQTGGEGWTLTAADAMISIDKPMSPAVQWQAEDRLRYHLQNRGVKYYSLQAMGTVEDRVEELLSRKQGMFTQLFGARSGT